MVPRARLAPDASGGVVTCALIVVGVIAAGYAVALWAALTGRLVSW